MSRHSSHKLYTDTSVVSFPQEPQEPAAAAPRATNSASTVYVAQKQLAYAVTSFVESGFRSDQHGTTQTRHDSDQLDSE